MVDDDLDLDLDLDSAPRPPRKSKPKPPAKDKAVAKPKPAKPTGDAARKTTVVPAHRPGLFSRALTRLGELLGRIPIPEWNLRNFVAGLIVLALAVVLAENWPPMRIGFIGFHIDVPKTLVLVIDFGLGFLVAWLIYRRRDRVKPEPGE